MGTIWLRQTGEEVNGFLGWLLARERQADISDGGKTIRRRASKFWHTSPLYPVTGEVCRRRCYHYGNRDESTIQVIYICSKR